MVTLAVVASHCVRNLQLDVIGSSPYSGNWTVTAWVPTLNTPDLIPDSLPDPSIDRQTRAQPVIDHCLVVLPTKEFVVLCLCRSVFVLGYGVTVSYNVTIESFCL